MSSLVKKKKKIGLISKGMYVLYLMFSIDV